MGLRNALRLVSEIPAPALEAASQALPVPQLASPFNPSALTSIVWADLLDVACLPMTRAEAMSVPAVAKARHVVAPKIAGTPIRVLRGVEQLPDPIWTYRTDDGISPWHRMLWTVDDLIFTGWSLWVGRRGSENELLAAQRVGRDRWRFDDDFRILVDDQPIPSTSAILIPGPHEGILTFGRTAIRHARQLLSAAATAGHNPSAQVELHQTQGDPMTQPDIDALVGAWVAARRGDNGGVGYTNQSIQLIEHGAIDGHLLVEGRNAAAVDCARLVGVAAAMVDATVPKSSLTYETTQGRGLEHTEYGVEPYAEAIAARLSLDDIVPRGQRVRFDIAADIVPVQPTGPLEED